MMIDNMVVGPIRTNVYLLANTETKELVLVDPGDEADRIAERIETTGFKPVAVLLTHGHYDHIMAVRELREKYGMEVIACKEEEGLLQGPMLNLSFKYVAEGISADRYVADGEVIELAGTRIRVLHTPGHTQGSCCYYLPDEKILFSGDTLFAGSCGRTDFPTSDPKKMEQSLERLMNEIPEDVTVYPGHEGFSTIGTEKRTNPYCSR